MGEAVARRNKLPWVLVPAGIALTIGLIVLMAEVWPIGPDYYFTFYRNATRYMQGSTRLYDDHPWTDVPGNPDIGFFNAPWALMVLVPLSLFPVQVGEAILNIGTLIGILVCLMALQRVRPIPPLAIAGALVNLHLFDMLLRGQIDGFPLFGAVLGWWAVQTRRPLWLSLAFALIAIKPLNASLPALVFLIGIWHWSWREKALVISIPVILVILSCMFFGLDWPLRYVDYAHKWLPPTDYLSTSLWRAFGQLGLPDWPLIPLAALGIASTIYVAWRTGCNQWVLAVALATNLVFTTYVHGNHYALLVPAFIYVARKDWRLALLAYAATWTPLLRLAGGFSAARFDVIYPIVLLAFLWVLRLRTARQNKEGQLATTIIQELRTETDREVNRLRGAASAA